MTQNVFFIVAPQKFLEASVSGTHDCPKQTLLKSEESV